MTANIGKWYTGDLAGKTRAVRKLYPDAHVLGLWTPSGDPCWFDYHDQPVVVLRDLCPLHIKTSPALAITIQRMVQGERFLIRRSESMIKEPTLTIAPLQLVVTSDWTIQECFPDNWEALVGHFDVIYME